MHNWANFCDITKFNVKTKNLVAQVASRFFLDKNASNKLINKTVYLVPPALDAKREFVVKSVKYTSSKQVEISLKDFSLEENEIVGKSLLLSAEDAIDVFGDVLLKEEDEFVGKFVVDKSIGKIGKIVDVAGTSAQKHLIVDYNNNEVLVPLNEDLIVDETKTEIIMNLPEGLLEINES